MRFIPTGNVSTLTVKTDQGTGEKMDYVHTMIAENNIGMHPLATYNCMLVCWCLTGQVNFRLDCSFAICFTSLCSV